MKTELRDLVLSEAAACRPTERGAYWLPLARPTYDGEEIVEALDAMLTYETTMGKRTARFEAEFSGLHGAAEALLVNSGSSADLLMMLAATEPSCPLLPKGSTVLVPAVTWPTQAWSVLMAGLNVRWVDVEPDTLNISARTLESAWSSECSAVFLVHLLGNPCPMDEIQEFCARRGLLLFEDCCEALGAEWNGQKVGTFGVAGSYSFFFAHHMMTMEGGALVTSHERLGRAMRLMRAHGWARALPEAERPAPPPGVDPRYFFLTWGLNVRPTEVAAAFGLKQLEKLPRLQQERAARFAAMAEVFRAKGFRTPRVLDKARPSWMALPLMPDETRAAAMSRDELVARLERGGVETRPIVAGNLAKQPAARLMIGEAGPLPGADQVHEQGCYVGNPAGALDPGEVERLERVVSDRG